MNPGSNPPLREQVYNYLKSGLNTGSLKAGKFLDLNAIGEELGLSRTPLRDALIRLEVEGFVVIHPRRGVMVKAIDIGEIRDTYQIIGALEASALLEIAPALPPQEIEDMARLNGLMAAALGKDDFGDYYGYNIRFHDAYLNHSANGWLQNTVHRCKARLYDFPRRSMYLKTWEEASIHEHEEIIGLLRAARWQDAAAYIRDVHWSFSAQEQYIKEYYFAGLNE